MSHDEPSESTGKDRVLGGLGGLVQRAASRAGKGADRVLEVAQRVGQSAAYVHALAARDRGNMQAAFWLLQEEWDACSENLDVDVAAAFWDAAVALGREEIATPAGIWLVEHRAGKGEAELATQLWVELVSATPGALVSPAAIVRLLPVLRRRIEESAEDARDQARALARRAMRHAVDPGNQELSVGVALRVFEEGHALNPEAARHAARVALESPDLHEAKRERLQGWLNGETITDRSSIAPPVADARANPEPEALSDEEVQALAARLPPARSAANPEQAAAKPTRAENVAVPAAAAAPSTPEPVAAAEPVSIDDADAGEAAETEARAEGDERDADDARADELELLDESNPALEIDPFEPEAGEPEELVVVGEMLEAELEEAVPLDDADGVEACIDAVFASEDADIAASESVAEAELEIQGQADAAGEAEPEPASVLEVEPAIEAQPVLETETKPAPEAEPELAVQPESDVPAEPALDAMGALEPEPEVEVEVGSEVESEVEFEVEVEAGSELEVAAVAIPDLEAELEAQLAPEPELAAEAKTPSDDDSFEEPLLEISEVFPAEPEPEPELEPESESDSDSDSESESVAETEADQAEPETGIAAAVETQSDLVAATPATSAIDVTPVVPIEISDLGLRVQVGGSERLVPWGAIEGLATVAIGQPLVLVIDLVDGLRNAAAPLRVLRLRADDFDAKAVLGREADPARALSELLAELLERSHATPLPDLESALGVRLACFPDVSAYEAEVFPHAGADAAQGDTPAEDSA